MFAQAAAVGGNGLGAVPVQVVAVGDLPLQRDAVGRRRLGGQGERLVDRQQVVLVDRRQRGRRAGKAKGEGGGDARPAGCERRSEEHTSELQSLMRSSYAVFCLKKKKRSKQAKA